MQDRTRPMVEALEMLATAGVAVVPALRCRTRLALVAEARVYAGWRAARPVVGVAQVRQRMEVCSAIPTESRLRDVARAFQARLERALATLREYPFETPLALDDLMLQRYAPGTIGITPHRDHVRYRNLIALFVLCGEGRFLFGGDRAGRGAREIPHRPGDVILSVAPGFRRRSERPMHSVRDIRSERYVFGLRQRAP